MAIDLRKNAKDHAIEVLSAIPHLAVYGRKAARQIDYPCVVVRKLAEDGYDYLDNRGEPSASVLRLEIRAASDAECDRAAAAIDEALRDGGRLMDKTLYFEGIEPGVGGESQPDSVYRLTLQYRIMET